MLLTTQYRRKEMADWVTALLLVVMKESYAHAGATGCFANAHAARLLLDSDTYETLARSPRAGQRAVPAADYEEGGAAG